MSRGPKRAPPYSVPAMLATLHVRQRMDAVQHKQIRQAMEEVAVDTEKIHINTHDTGTRLNSDHACDLDVCPNEARISDIELALNNSMGFGEHNCCLAFKSL